MTDLKTNRSGGRAASIHTSSLTICDFLGCGKVFDRWNSGNLARNKRSVHVLREERNENLRCDCCSASFSRLDGKFNHIRRKHTT
jgi:hypothetical protein